MLQFYKPNPSSSGYGIGLSFNSKEAKLYVEVIKQVSWDAAKKEGSFKGGKKFNVTFNSNEIGAILNTLERGLPSKFFHSTAKGSVSIDVSTFFKKVPNSQEKGPKDGISLSINPKAKEGEAAPDRFGFWFNESEARTLRAYLEFALNHFFSAAYSAEKARREAYLKQKGA